MMNNHWQSSCLAKVAGTRIRFVWCKMMNHQNCPINELPVSSSCVCLYTPVDLWLAYKHRRHNKVTSKLKFLPVGLCAALAFGLWNSLLTEVKCTIHLVYHPNQQTCDCLIVMWHCIRFWLFCPCRLLVSSPRHIWGDQEHRHRPGQKDPRGLLPPGRPDPQWSGGICLH